MGIFEDQGGVKVPIEWEQILKVEDKSCCGRRKLREGKKMERNTEGNMQSEKRRMVG